MADKIQDVLGDAIGSEVLAAATQSLEQGGKAPTISTIMEEARERGATEAQLQELKASLVQRVASSNNNVVASSSGISEKQLAKLQSGLEGKSAVAVAEAALNAGASPSQVLQLAVDQGATEQELSNISASIRATSGLQIKQAGADESVLMDLQEDMANESPKDIVEAALSLGASSTQAVQLALEQGASSQELQEIQKMIQTKSIGDLQEAVRESDPQAAVEAALSMGLTPAQTVQFAKDNGASSQDLAQIQRLAQNNLPTQSVSESSGNNNRDMGIPQSQITALKKNMGSQNAMQMAKAAASMGASAKQVLQLAKEQGATKQEMAQISRNLTAKGAQVEAVKEGIPESTIKTIQGKMEGKSATEVVQAALSLGASAEQAKQIALEQGVSKKEMQNIQSIIDHETSSRSHEAYTTDSISDSKMDHLKEIMRGESASAIAEEAIAMGATTSQALQMAAEMGASRQEMAKISNMVQNQNDSIGQVNFANNKQMSQSSTTGISNADLSDLMEELNGEDPTQAAKIALSAGASPGQVMQIAIEQGASKRELSQIQSMVQNSKGSSNRNDGQMLQSSTTGVSNADLSDLMDELDGEDPTQAAKIALSVGASPGQVMQIAIEQGASKKELSQIQSMVQNSKEYNSDTGFSLNGNVPQPSVPLGVSKSELSDLQSALKDEEPATVAKAALSLGASPSQALQAALEQGASPEEIAEIKQAIVESSADNVRNFHSHKIDNQCGNATPTPGTIAKIGN